MKQKAHFLITIFLLASIFSAVFYVSCSKTDKCLNVICKNGGSCDGGKCTCPIGYDGPKCDTLARDKFVFNYNGGDSCGVNDSLDTVRHYGNPLRLKANIYKPLELTMQNFLNNPDDSSICTMLKTDSFAFQGSNNSTTWSGSGWLRHDTLRMAYHVIHDTTSYDCHYLGLIY